MFKFAILSTSGGDLAPSFGGRKHFSRGSRFLNDVLFGKNFHFHSQNFWWPFLVIDQVFRIFPLFSQIFPMLNVVYEPFLTRTTAISEKNSFMTLFLLCSYFCAHPATLLLKILGGTDAWAVPPPQILGEPSFPVPLGLHPCFLHHCRCSH